MDLELPSLELRLPGKRLPLQEVRLRVLPARCLLELLPLEILHWFQVQE